MSREDYLFRLEMLLHKKLSKAEAQDILRDYREFFEDGGRQGMTDVEIILKLGSPDLVAEQVLQEFEGDDSILPREKFSSAAGVVKTTGKGMNEALKFAKKPFAFLLRAAKTVLRCTVIAFIVLAVLFTLGLILFAAGALFFFAILLLIASCLAMGLLPVAVVFTGIFGGLFLLCLALLSSLVLYAAAKKSYRTAEQVYFHKKEVLSDAA